MEVVGDLANHFPAVQDHDILPISADHDPIVAVEHVWQASLCLLPTNFDIPVVLTALVQNFLDFGWHVRALSHIPSIDVDPLQVVWHSRFSVRRNYLAVGDR